MDEMAIAELALEPGKHYRVKIFDEQPFPELEPHRQINPDSLGKAFEIELRSFGKDSFSHTHNASGEFMVTGFGQLGRVAKTVDDREVTEGLLSFHHWLIESIEAI